MKTLLKIQCNAIYGRLSLNCLSIIVCTILITFTTNLVAQQPAFPGAEGAGKYTVGGRGGVVYEVTNLNDSGAGSLRDAVKANGPRTIVFRVSGTIILKSALNIDKPNLTIAGQTAPGDGICLRGYQCVVKANDVIIRYMRFRLGDETGVDTDCFWGRYYKNIILDHCSASWSVDEVMSFYGNENFTMQWCLVAESLYMSNHPKGAHGYGGIWGGKNASFHHNLIAHHSSRTPRFSGGETTPCENVDFRNNVIYNWGFNSAYGGESGKINMVANYYKAGPATKSSVKNRIVQLTDGNGEWYIEDNFVAGYPAITENNWAGGVQGSYANEAISRVTTPNPYTPVTEQTAEEAYLLVLENVGANLPVRDAVDNRIINDVKTGAATCDGYYYEINQGFSDTAVVRGIIDSQNDVGGWPELASLSAPADTDHDGMPDEWESANGLNLNDDSDRNLVAENGYTMLENYLNSLVDSGQTLVQHRQAEPGYFSLLQNYPNPFNMNTKITFTIDKSDLVTIKIFDITGRLVKNLYRQICTPGTYHVEWNGVNDWGNAVATGIYFCELSIKSGKSSMKMHLLR